MGEWFHPVNEESYFKIQRATLGEFYVIINNNNSVATLWKLAYRNRDFAYNT